MAESTASEPLLDPNKSDTPPRSRIGAGAITTLGAAKVLLGVAGVVAPRFLGQVFLLHIPTEAYIITRLFGSSVAAFGGSLLATDRIVWNQKYQDSATNREILQAIVVANIVADSVDIVSCSAALLSGAVKGGTFGMLGGGCVALAALGVIGLRGV